MVDIDHAGRSADEHRNAPASLHSNNQRHLSLSDEDESVMIAVRALDDMRSRAMPPPLASTSYHAQTSPSTTPALSRASTSTSPSIRSSQIMLPIDDLSSPDFVSRVSGLPIVNTALRAYEHSKASSRVVKYGAEMMESSVKTISKPVIDRLPVNQLDEFACRQLDRLGYGRTGSEETLLDNKGKGPSEDNTDRQFWEEEWYRRLREKAVTSPETSREASAAPSDTASIPDETERQDQRDVVSRGPWHAILTEAGGIGAAVSEESMRRLQYCLQWLQYATQHIDARIIILRDFISSLKPHNRQRHRGNDEEAVVSGSHLQTLSNVKKDIVETIRQVVDVVSKYAGGALPEPARARVRQFILHLPQRIAVSVQRSDGSQTPVASRTSTANSTHGGLPTVMPYPSQPRQARPTAVAATQAAQRILTLATESLDMMRSVTVVFKETLDRAEAWVERLRVVGIQRPSPSDLSNLLQRDESAREDDPMVFGTRVYQAPPPDSILSTSSSSQALTGVTASSLGALSLSPTYGTRNSSATKLFNDNDWHYTSSRSITSDARDDAGSREDTAGAREQRNRLTMDVDA